jgi:FlaA1/EpsC-like NDP-sugar epimerase
MPKYKVRNLLERFPNASLHIIGLQEGEKMREVLYREGEKINLIDVN